MIELFAHPFSSYSWKVLIALWENGTPFTYRALRSGDEDSDARFEALWPAGKFPLLVDDGKPVMESSIIIEYLGRHHPGPVSLIPVDPDAALEVRKLDRIFDNYLMTPMQAIVGDALRGEGDRDAFGVTQAHAALDRAYAWLEAELAEREWATGDAFTLADCAAAPALFYADWVHPIGAEQATLRAYRARLLARVLRPFSKVRPDEAATVVLMTLTSFVLLSAYYLLKTVREPLVLLHGGAEMKLYLRAAQAILMLGVVHVYGKLARRVGRATLLASVYLFFIANLSIFALLARAHVEIALPFFLWVGVFSYTSIAQFWALAADIYSDEQGKRLFPIIGGGSSVGAVAGGLFARELVPYGPFALMATAVVMLVGCVLLIRWIEHRSRGTVVVHAEAEAPLSEESPWSLLAR